MDFLRYEWLHLALPLLVAIIASVVTPKGVRCRTRPALHEVLAVSVGITALCYWFWPSIATAFYSMGPVVWWLLVFGASGIVHVLMRNRQAAYTMGALMMASGLVGLSHDHYLAFSMLGHSCSGNDYGLAATGLAFAVYPLSFGLLGGLALFAYAIGPYKRGLRDLPPAVSLLLLLGHYMAQHQLMMSFWLDPGLDLISAYSAAWWVTGALGVALAFVPVSGRASSPGYRLWPRVAWAVAIAAHLATSMFLPNWAGDNDEALNIYSPGNPSHHSTPLDARLSEQEYWFAVATRVPWLRHPAYPHGYPGSVTIEIGPPASPSVPVVALSKTNPTVLQVVTSCLEKGAYECAVQPARQ